MATAGKSGSFSLSGTKGASVWVDWQEYYDTTTNESSVEITGIWVKSSSWYGITYYPNGSVSVAGSKAVSMNSVTPTHSVYISGLGKWAKVSGSLGTVSGITHNDDGTKSVSLSISIKGYTVSGNYGSGWSVSGSQTIDLTTIARKSTLTASNGTLGTAQTLTISRQSSSFYHSIRYTCGDVDAAICTKVSGTSISFTPSLNLAKQNISGTSVSITFTLYTFADGSDDATEIGRTTKTITCAIPSSVKPTCITSYSDFEVSDSYAGFLQGVSKLEIDVDAELAYDSPIVDYTVSVNGKTYKYSSITINPITWTGDTVIKAKVTDMRGRTSEEVSVTAASVLPYSPPSVTRFKTIRCDSDGTENQQGNYVKVIYSFSSSTSLNTSPSIILKYKKTEDTDYTYVTLSSAYSATNAETIFEADTEYSYNVVLTVSDGINSISRSTTVSTAYAYMDWDYGNKTFALGKIAEKTNAFECGWTQYDKFGTLAGNGLAAYTGAGDSGIDPDTTIESLILTNNNTPVSGAYMYIHTMFYTTKSSTANRAQIAIPYAYTGKNMYYRYYWSSAWSSWTKLVNEDETDGKSVILWTNASPTSSFAGQTITVSGLSNYNLFTVICRRSTSASHQTSATMYAPDTTRIYGTISYSMVSSSGEATVSQRNVSILKSNNTVIFSYGWLSPSASDNATVLIPLYIIGRKI